MGLLSRIFADDSDGPINKGTLYTLCILVLDIIRETEDLKSSKYLKALISFQVFPTHLKEKQFNPIKYCSGFILKSASKTGKRYKESIQLMKLEIEQTIRVISKSTSKPIIKESDDIESITSNEMKEVEGNSIQAESTNEMFKEDDTGIANCLINLDFDEGPKVPEKRDPVILDDSEIEDSSQDLDSDEEDLRSGKLRTSIDHRPTKWVKSGTPSTGRAYIAPLQILQAQSTSQSHFPFQDLVKALSTMNVC